MSQALQIALFAGAFVGLAALGLQLVLLHRHLAESPPEPAGLPGISVLKPLCGVDDDLEQNLELFAALEWPRYEVLLGVRDASDAAWPVASAAARRWPGRFRVVLQRGEPGMNPKVNQLVTLARAARHDILVVSDSNVRVPGGYLSEIAAWLEDPEVGLVTHPVVGVGEERLGSLFDNLHMAGSVAGGMVAAKRVAGKDLVVGKSMAIRRRDLAALGGFEAVKDVLAEDYVMGRMVPRVLGKKVVVARLPIENVNRRRGLRDFVSRYGRWGIMQRRLVGPFLYGAQALLNPVWIACLGFVSSPGPRAIAALLGVCVGKVFLDGVAGRLLRPRGFAWRSLALVPAKDLAFGVAWAHGLLWSTVTWRGNRLRILEGSRIERPAEGAGEGALAAG